MSEKSKEDNCFVTLVRIHYTDHDGGEVFFRFGQWSREEVLEEFKGKLNPELGATLEDIRHVKVYRRGGRNLLYRFRSLLKGRTERFIGDFLTALEWKHPVCGPCYKGDDED